MVVKRSEHRLREGAERARFLSDATKVLTSSLNPTRAFSRLAELAVPALGDFCFFDIVTEAAVLTVGQQKSTRLAERAITIRSHAVMATVPAPPGAAGVGPHEAVEDLPLLFGWNARPTVADEAAQTGFI